MRKVILGLITTAIFCLSIWIAGIRIIVIQPIGAIPDGVTAVMIGVRNVNFVDSPDAICNRTHGGVSLLCRGATAAALARTGTIILKLPYSDFLYSLSGAPRLSR